LAFYTKQYFILGMAILCLYLFLYHSMSKALILGAIYATCLLGTLTAVHYTSPYYLDNTLFTPSAAMAGLQTVDILFIQLRTYLATYSGLLVVMLIAAFTWVYSTGLSKAFRLLTCRFQLAKAGLQGPVFNSQIDFFWFGLFWSSMAIVVTLGQNPGNYMTYLFSSCRRFC
jgi:fucose 4-O-acetylase-like acetyltransferase